MPDSWEISQEILLSGFDPEGEPIIRVMGNGSLIVVFEFMPPSWAEGGWLEGFEVEMANAVGADVLWDDREVFIIQNPAAESLNKLRAFVNSYRKNWTKRKKKPSMQDRILEGLKEAFAESGFRVNKSKGSLRRRIPGGWQEAGLALHNYHPIYNIALHGCIHLNAVNEILNPFYGMEPRYWKDSVTTVAQMEYFTGGVVARYEVSSEEDIAVALKELFALVPEKMIPFFDQHCDVAALDRSLHAHIASSDYQEPAGQDERAYRRTINGMNIQHRAASGIIIAHLAANPNFEKVVAHYCKELGVSPGASENKFNQLAKLLRTQREA